MVDRREESVRTLFSEIAPVYDRMNHLASLGLDISWRRRLAAALRDTLYAKKCRCYTIIDHATGTGDLAFTIRRMIPEAIIAGYDASAGMIAKAKEKATRMDMRDISFREGCASSVVRTDADAVSIAFGIRNIEENDRVLRSIRDTVVQGGILALLEFFAPRSFLHRFLLRSYVRIVIPVLAFFAGGGKISQYRYLFESIDEFYTASEFIDHAIRHGFRLKRRIRFFFGIAEALIFIRYEPAVDRLSERENA